MLEPFSDTMSFVLLFIRTLFMVRDKIEGYVL